MSESAARRVSDDPGLLALILNDWYEGGTRDELTGSLIDFYDRFSQLLTEQTLKNNIGQAIRGITGVNGCDLSPIQRTLAGLQNNQKTTNIAGSIRESLTFIEQNPDAKVLPYELSLNDLNQSAFRICELYSKLHGAPSIRSINMSENHYPDYLFSVDGKQYSYVFLYYYYNYVYCSRFIDFSTVSNVIEIGPGAGRQVEIIKKFHPHLNFYLVDLGPSLYLCHQYLKSMFPEDLISYESTRETNSVCIEGEGKIAFLGNANISNINPRGSTVFVSQSTLGLMTPNTAERYLDKCSSISDFIFMIESQRDDSRGTYTLEDSACLTDFHNLLDEKFLLIDQEPAFYPLSAREGFGGFEMMMWKRS